MPKLTFEIAKELHLLKARVPAIWCWSETITSRKHFCIARNYSLSGFSPCKPVIFDSIAGGDCGNLEV